MSRKHLQKKLTIEGSNSFDSSTDEAFLTPEHLEVPPAAAVFRQPRRTPSGKWRRTASDTGIRRTLKTEALIHSAAKLSDNVELWKTLNRHSNVVIDKPMKNGLTALHECVLHNNLDGVKILLWYKADPNVVDGEGFSALHWAAVYGYLDLASMLLAHQADIFAKTPEGDMPVDLALDGQTYRFLYDEMILQSHAKLLVQSWIEYYFWDFLGKLQEKITCVGELLVEWIKDMCGWVMKGDTKTETEPDNNVTNVNDMSNHVKHK